MPRPEALRVTVTAIGEDVQGTFVQVSMTWTDLYGHKEGRHGHRLRLGEALRFAFSETRPSIGLMKPEKKEG